MTNAQDLIQEELNSILIAQYTIMGVPITIAQAIAEAIACYEDGLLSLS